MGDTPKRDERPIFCGVDWGTPDQTTVSFARKTEGEAVEVLAILQGPAAHALATALERLEAAEREATAAEGYLQATDRYMNGGASIMVSIGFVRRVAALAAQEEKHG